MSYPPGPVHNRCASSSGTHIGAAAIPEPKTFVVEQYRAGQSTGELVALTDRSVSAVKNIPSRTGANYADPSAQAPSALAAPGVARSHLLAPGRP